MTVFENLFIGQEKRFRHLGLLSRRKMLEEAREALDVVGMNVLPEALLFDLSFIQRQMVEIARIIWFSKECGILNPIVILDEPTTMLEPRDVDALFQTIAELKKKVSVIYISHRLKEIVDLCDRVYVLKDGRNAGSFEKRESNEESLRVRMVGRDFHGEYYLTSAQRREAGATVLELRNCTRGMAFRDVSFILREGEILSICGTVGSGKENLCKCMFGIQRFAGGEMFLRGKKVRPRSPAEAFRMGIGYVPEDRRSDGLVLGMSLFDNITLPVLGTMRRALFISRRRQIKVSATMIEKLNIKTKSASDSCNRLSGGNQQKVILAKWLLSGVKVMILSHPTRGVDVGAKHEIYSFIRELAAQGIALIVLGDSFEEEIGLANRIMVMKDGEVRAFIDANGEKPSPQSLIEYMV
jgi:ribose transport system ATP-binding protein